MERAAQPVDGLLPDDGRTRRFHNGARAVSYLAEFGYADIAGERITSAAGLISAIGSLAAVGHVFAKETTGRHYPEVLADRQFLATGALHTFLIRHPRETISSYHALDPGAGLHKIGFESQYEIFAEVCRLPAVSPWSSIPKTS